MLNNVASLPRFLSPPPHPPAKRRFITQAPGSGGNEWCPAPAAPSSLTPVATATLFRVSQHCSNIVQHCSLSLPSHAPPRPFLARRQLPQPRLDALTLARTHAPTPAAPSRARKPINIVPTLYAQSCSRAFLSQSTCLLTTLSLSLSLPLAPFLSLPTLHRAHPSSGDSGHGVVVRPLPGRDYPPRPRAARRLLFHPRPPHPPQRRRGQKPRLLSFSRSSVHRVCK